MNLQMPVSELIMVGEAYAKKLQRLNIKTIENLIHHYPVRYQDFSSVLKINQLQNGETATVRGKVVSFKVDYVRRGRVRNIQKAVLADETGQLQAVWFNQPFLTKIFVEGAPIFLAGKVKEQGSRFEMNSPEFETSDSIHIHTGCLAPIYPETYGVSSKWLRSRIAHVLKTWPDELDEFLPAEIQEKNDLIGFRQAITQIHFPDSLILAGKARKRLAFDELFLLQLNNLLTRQEWERVKIGRAFEIGRFQNEIAQFYANLPFALTTAQRRCAGEILTSLRSEKAMNRLLQGDVGSGKTVVAAIAAYISFLNGFQTLLMAPTEILAAQHFKTLERMLKPAKGIRLGIYSRSQKQELLADGQEKRLDWKRAKDLDVLVGTQALLNQKLKFEKLGLVIVDEQHRFGVKQRAVLTEKGVHPHLLSMTATPIPRTMALTVFGQLDLSTIDEMPPGRLRVKTWVVPKKKQMAAYEWIRKNVKCQKPNVKNQVFIICPLIEESEKETMKSVKAATVEYQKLKEQIFPDLNVGLLHGRLKASDKETAIEAFRSGKTDVLVATSVVEVGVDIPGASIMAVEGAERFGLAQLHQLRGRVGRSNQQAYCLLFPQNQSPTAYKRLKLLEENSNGMILAEEDLRIRGPGEVYGTAQHGNPFEELKLANIYDLVLIEKTKQAADWIMGRDPELDNFKPLQQRVKSFKMGLIKPN